VEHFETGESKASKSTVRILPPFTQKIYASGLQRVAILLMASPDYLITVKLVPLFGIMYDHESNSLCSRSAHTHMDAILDRLYQETRWNFNFIFWAIKLSEPHSYIEQIYQDCKKLMYLGITITIHEASCHIYIFGLCLYLYYEFHSFWWLLTLWNSRFPR